MHINSIQNSSYYPSWNPQARFTPLVDTQTNINQVKGNRAISGSDNQDSENIKKKIGAEAADKLKGELSQSEKMVVNELKKTDAAVRKHEMAHIAAGGKYILSGANFSYTTGPDGKQYVVGGEVKIDTAPIPGDPQATINKMRKVRGAALAPASPSAQDRKVASTAMTLSTKAMSELMIERTKHKTDSNEEKAFGNIRHQADNAYMKVKNMPVNQQDPLFKISA